MQFIWTIRMKIVSGVANSTVCSLDKETLKPIIFGDFSTLIFFFIMQNNKKSFIHVIILKQNWNINTG